jgi:hypothetical protein
MTRKELAYLAADVAMGVSSFRGRTNLRVVVLVSDDEGEFVGVGANVSGNDARLMIRCTSDRLDSEDYTVPYREGSERPQ